MIEHRKTTESNPKTQKIWNCLLVQMNRIELNLKYFKLFQYKYLRSKRNIGRKN